MKQLALLARFTHFTNILISTATVALCFQIAVLLDWRFIPFWFYVFMFSNTFLQYGLHDLYSRAGSTNAKPKLAFWLRNRSYFIALIVASAFVSAFLCVKLTGTQFYWFGVLGVLTLAYSFPLLPFKNLKRFKQHGPIKLLVLTLVWTISTTIIPATFIPFGFDTKFIFLLGFRFFFMLAICIPFDIRDDMADTKHFNITMVGLFGENGCYHLSYASLVAAAVLLIPGYFAGILPGYIFTLLASLIVTWWMVGYSRKHQFSPNSYIMLDGSMILQTLLICIPVLFS